jgi:hypothetical protein
MSTSPKNQDAMFPGAKPRAAAQPTPGELQWSVRKRNLTVIACELRDNGPTAGVEVQLLRDGEWFYGRRWPNRAAALVEVDDMKAEQLARGGTLLPGREQPR